jgi:hypothetical protein
MARKAQMEIMGLAIIVIIIIIGLVFSLRFMRPVETQDLKDTFTDSTLASNLLNVMLKTTLECKDIELKNLLQDCAEGIATKEYCPGKTDPCAFSKEIITLLLTDTLTVMKRDFVFEAKFPSAGSFTVPERDKVTCTAANLGAGKKYQTRTFESYPLPTKRGTMEITLALCR